MSEKLSNKTCGECKHFSCSDEGQCMDDEWTFCDSDACEKFQSKVVTNGDEIIAGGIRAIASLVCCHRCGVCIYANYKAENTGLDQGGFTCECPSGKTCLDGIEAYLNAPAESEGEDE